MYRIFIPESVYEHWNAIINRVSCKTVHNVWTVIRCRRIANILLIKCRKKGWEKRAENWHAEIFCNDKNLTCQRIEKKTNDPKWLSMRLLHTRNGYSSRWAKKIACYDEQGNRRKTITKKVAYSKVFHSRGYLNRAILDCPSTEDVKMLIELKSFESVLVECS